MRHVRLPVVLRRHGALIAESAAHKYGHPERDRDLLRSLSPLHRVDALRVPVLAVHGEYDTNVPPGESEQFVRAARERGSPPRC